MTEENVLDAFGQEIQAEHTLISHRMSWYATSQSFLFSAFAIVGGNGNAWTGFLLFGLPVLGLILSVLARRGIGAAITVQNDLIGEQENLVKKLESDWKEQPEKLAILALRAKMTCYGRRSRYELHYSAMKTTKAIPVVFMLAWVIAPICGVLALQFTAQSVFGIATLVALLSFVGVILYLTRRLLVSRIQQLEHRMLGLESIRQVGGVVQDAELGAAADGGGMQAFPGS